MRRELTFAEQLCYITTRMVTEKKDGTGSIGTGFFVEFYSEGVPVTLLVTNKHVVKEAEKISIRLNKADEEGNPIDTEWLDVNISNAKDYFIYHPDDNVDLAVCVISLITNAIRNKIPIFFKTIPPNLMVTDSWTRHLDAIEDVIMVGYPNSLFDEAHNRPIVRRGITATDPKLDYKKERLFLIDCSCLPGSSGSPVLLYRKRMVEKTPKETRFPRVSKLMGILCSMPIMPAIKLSQEAEKYIQPLNLGNIIKVQCLFDFFPLIKKKQ